MDLPLLGAALIVGISWGSHIWGHKPESIAPVAPCICHCECAATRAESSTVKLWFLLVILILSWIGFGLCWALCSSREVGVSSTAKGKGKKGVLGGSLALTLQ